MGEKRRGGTWRGEHVLFLFSTCCLIVTFCLPRNESTDLEDQPISPRYTPCIFISQTGSALSHRVNSRQTKRSTIVFSSAHVLTRWRVKARSTKKPQRIWDRTRVRFSLMELVEALPLRPPGRSRTDIYTYLTTM